MEVANGLDNSNNSSPPPKKKKKNIYIYINTNTHEMYNLDIVQDCKIVSNPLHNVKIEKHPGSASGKG